MLAMTSALAATSAPAAAAGLHLRGSARSRAPVLSRAVLCSSRKISHQLAGGDAKGGAKAIQLLLAVLSSSMLAAAPAALAGDGTWLIEKQFAQDVGELIENRKAGDGACYKRCIKECNKIAPGSKDYCVDVCTDECAAQAAEKAEAEAAASK